MAELDVTYVTLSEYDGEGLLVAQCDTQREDEEGGEPPDLTYQPLGLHARPVDPDGEDAALAIRWADGSEAFVLLLDDPRAERALPELTKGATCLHDTLTGEHRLTLDHEGKRAHLEVPAGSTIVFEIAGGPKFEVSGTAVKVTNATSVEAGGAEQLSKFTQLSSALNAVASALTACAGGVMPPAAAAAGTAAGNAVAAIQTFASTGATLITKGS